MLFFLRWAIRLSWWLIGLFFVALIHSNVSKWAETNHWDSLLTQISGRSLSNFFGFLSNFLGFLTSQHWFWFLSGISVGVIIGVWLRKLLAKVEAEKTTLQIDYEGVEGANKVETTDDVFIRARVRNIGPVAAKNVRALLTSLEEVSHSGQTTPTPSHDSQMLAWAGWDFKPRDVPASPDAKFYVDLMRVSKFTSGWIFCAQQVFSGLAKLKDYKGTLRFYLTLTADNAPSTTCEVDVTYHQDWHTLRAEPVRRRA